MRPALTSRLEPFGVSVFSEMTRLANEHQAINLSQGFPDFDGPAWLKEAACDAILRGPNQYAPSHGLPVLRRAIADVTRRYQGLSYDADSEVTVYSGGTEAIFSVINGIVEPGDEVVLFEPFYDSYPASVAMAGGFCRCVPLRWPDFHFDEAELTAAFSERTRLVILNTPNNPTGKVFSLPEMEALAALVRKHDAYVLTDEVYEHLVYDGHRHLPFASLPGMRERTIILSSTAKTFSMTGWKIGYTLAPPDLSRAARSAHQFVTFCSATPLQAAMAAALDRLDDYLPELQREYTERRDLLVGILQQAGFVTTAPQGTYFALADFRPLGFEDDVSFCRFLVTECRVAAIPPTAFYEHKEHGRHLVRFAFCKQLDTLRAAGERLQALRQLKAP